LNPYSASVSIKAWTFQSHGGYFIRKTGLEVTQYHLIQSSPRSQQKDEGGVSIGNSGAPFHGIVIGFLAQVINISEILFDGA
jgi:hypothetical protein